MRVNVTGNTAMSREDITKTGSLLMPAGTTDVPGPPSVCGGQVGFAHYTGSQVSRPCADVVLQANRSRSATWSATPYLIMGLAALPASVPCLDSKASPE
jgi:hypothetical protein